MTYNDVEKARHYQGALREIFIHHPGGWADREALAEVQKLARHAMAAVSDDECQERMDMVERYAAALYSDAQHHNWRMSSLPGADFLRLQILRALDAFSTRLGLLEAGREQASERPTRPAA